VIADSDSLSSHQINQQREQALKTNQFSEMKGNVNQDNSEDHTTFGIPRAVSCKARDVEILQKSKVSAGTAGHNLQIVHRCLIYTAGNV
jgi:hypothetical protein